MHDDLPYFDLMFPSIPIGGRETPPNLKSLLFKGGASAPQRKVDQATRDGSLGNVLQERIELVRLIHEAINGKLVGGGSAATARTQIKHIRIFWQWAEKFGATLSISDVQKVYLEWVEYLLHRVRVEKSLKRSSAYTVAMQVGQALDAALGRATPMGELSRLKKPGRQKRPQGAAADKQNLQATFAFGRLLQSTCDGVSLAVIWGPLQPWRIPLQQGGEIVIKPSGRVTPHENNEGWTSGNLKRSRRSALAYEADRTLNHPYRRDLVNLRVQAELLMFIGQTGMNLTQAQNLQLSHFSYSSDIDGYKVRDYKRRRGGEVLFEIFAEYRIHFERYLDWRRELFPNEEKRLFPIIRPKGVRENRLITFSSLKAACKQAGVPWIPPQKLRGTRVNWLLRESGNPDLTAEMSQHSKQTLLSVYETPSLQRAFSEVTRFWQRNDPELSTKEPVHPVGPGACDGVPKPSTAKPESVPEPDCRRPSGCLWCEHHRDIDSLDYVWSIVCFRHLKILELSKDPLPMEKREVIHPAEHAIKRLSKKLSWFRDSNAIRCAWAEEALNRVEEGYYHDQWSYLIEAMEGVSK
jgi:hypothetical protein